MPENTLIVFKKLKKLKKAKRGKIKSIVLDLRMSEPKLVLGMLRLEDNKK